MDSFDVVVAGSGPTGMVLAYELTLAGLSVALLEEKTVRSDRSRAFSMQPRTAEMLDLRGLLDDAYGRMISIVPNGHFAGLPVELKYESWNTRHPYILGIGQAAVERMVEERLAVAGLQVLYGHRVIGLEQDEEGVNVEISKGDNSRIIRSAYLVGCDGGRSIVRKTAGIDFPGTDPHSWGFVSDLRLKRTTQAVPKRWDSNVGMFGVQRPTTRLVIMIPLDNEGNYRLGVVDTDPAAKPASRDVPLTIEEVEIPLREYYGDEVEVEEISWASRFTDSTRQAVTYRDRRILLAGDAAHTHMPAGGQGMNLGIQDAMNLGWKLAAEINGWAPEGLLDSYHHERHPVGAEVLENTLAQTLYQLPTGDPRVRAARSLFIEIMKQPGIVHHIAGKISGLGIRYTMNDADNAPDLLGARMPDIELRVSRDGVVRRMHFSELMRDGRALMLTIRPEYAERANGWNDRVATIVVPILPLPGQRADALLIRPDGYVCWVASSLGVESSDLEGSLRQWFGEARVEASAHHLEDEIISA